VLKSLDSVTDKYKETLRTVERLKKEGIEIKFDIEDPAPAIKKSLEDLLDSFKKGVISAKQFKDEYENIVKSAFNVSESVNNLNKELGNLDKKIEDTRNELDESSDSFKKISKRCEEAAEQADAFAKSQKALNEKLDSNILGRFSKALSNVSLAAGGSASVIDKLSQSVGSGAGKVLIYGAATAVAVKGISSLGGKIRESIDDFTKYNITLENVSRTSYVAPGGVTELEGLRKTVGVTRESFATFAGDLDKLGKVGFQIKDVDVVAKNIVKQFGKGSMAQEALREVTNLMVEFPTLKEDLSLTATLDDKASALYGLAKEGKMDVAIKAGFFGAPDMGPNAKIASDIADSKTAEEDIKYGVYEQLKKVSNIIPLMTKTNMILEVIASGAAIASSTLQLINMSIIKSMFIKGKAAVELGGTLPPPGLPNGRGPVVPPPRASFLPPLVDVPSVPTPNARTVSGGNLISSISKFGPAIQKITGVLVKGAGVVGGLLTTYDALKGFSDLDVEGISERSNGVVASLSGLDKSVMSYQERLDSAADSASKESSTFDAAIKGSASYVDSFGSAVFNTGGDLASLTAELAGGGAMIGTFFGPAGIAIGAASGAALGLTISLVKLTKGALGLESEQEKLQKAALEELDARMRLTGDVDRTKFVKYLKDSAKLLKKINEIDKKQALSFQATIRRLDAVSKSAAFSLQDMQASVAEASMEISTMFGGTSKNFFKEAEDFATASGKRMSRAIDDYTKIMVDASNNKDLSGETLSIAFQEFNKKVLEEQKKFASAMDKLINTIGNTPDVIQARLKRGMAGIGQDIAEAFGTSSEASEISGQLAKKASLGIEQLGKTADDSARIMSEAIKNMQEREKSFNAMREANIKVASGVKTGDLTSAGASVDLAKKAVAAIESMKKGVKVDNLAEIAKELKPIYEKKKEDVFDIERSKGVAKTLTQGYMQGGSELSLEKLQKQKEEEESKRDALDRAQGGDFGGITETDFKGSSEKIKEGGEALEKAIKDNSDKMKKIDESIVDSTYTQEELENNLEKHLEELAKGLELQGDSRAAKKVKSYSKKDMKDPEVQQALREFAGQLLKDAKGVFKSTQENYKNTASAVAALDSKSFDRSTMVLTAVSKYMNTIKESFLQTAADLNKVIETKSHEVIVAEADLNLTTSIGDIGSVYGNVKDY
jgi:methyl-accepting chemotaxis protein